MDKAFLSLLEGKDFAYITVKEVCACSGVSRSTFYLHYETMNDLLAESLAYMHTQFLSGFGQARCVSDALAHCPAEELHLLRPEYLRPYLEFIRAHRTLYRTAIQNPAVFRTEEVYELLFHHVFNGILDRFSVPEEERHYRMKFYLSGIAAIVDEWLRCDCADSVERIMAVICRCVETP